ncbi:MAG: hypothetical protein Q8R31_06115, partial [Candidatus Omnitrophota bacterium]|nr:hypothetical protein [Candidatus Omnitrophota bacterium]
MSHQLKKSKLKLKIGLLAFIAVSLFLFIQEAFAYQIKRVVSGNYTMPVGTEATTVDISSLLGGTPLNTSSSFLSFTRRHADDERTFGDIVGYIDDPTNLLFSRAVSTTAIDIAYQIVEFNSGARIIGGVTTMPETRTSKNITLPFSIALNRTIPFLSWKSFGQNTTSDETNMFGLNLTSSNTMEIMRSQTATARNNDLFYYLVEFDRDVNVTQGTSVINGTLLNQSVSVSDVNKTLLVTHLMPSADVNGTEGGYFVRGYLASPNNITFQRFNTTSDLGVGTNVTIYWYLAEFQNQAFSQKGTGRSIPQAASSYTNLTNITVAPQWNLSRSLVVHSEQANINGTGSGEDSWTTSLLVPIGSDVYINLSRYASAASDDIPLLLDYNVIEFPPLDVLSPNDNESWFVGDSRTVSWALADSTKNHNLDLR